MKTLVVFRVCLVFLLTGLLSESAMMAQLQQVWGGTNPFNEPFRLMALDGQGNVHMAGHFESDLFAVKFSQTGTQDWAQRVGPAIEFAYANVADDVGNVWVAGTSTAMPNAFEDNIIVSKFNSSGNLQWSQIFTQRYARGSVFLAVDHLGNSFAAAFYQSPSSSSNPRFASFVVKYSPEGNLVWSREYLPTNGANVFLSGLAVDTQGDVVLAGYAWKPDSGSETLLIKYRPDGTLAWSEIHNYGVSQQLIQSLAIDHNDNIFAAGIFGAAFVAKYDPDGGRLWFYNQAHPRYNAYPRSIKLDRDGNAFLGTIDYRSFCYDQENDNCHYSHTHIITKLDADGTQLWQSRYELIDSDSLVFELDGPGNIYVQTRDGIRKIVPNGTTVLNSTTALPKPLLGFEVDQTGNIYAFGTNFVGKFSQSIDPSAPLVSTTNLIYKLSPGQNVTLSPDMQGQAPLSFRWYHYSADSLTVRVVGTNSSLTLTNVGREHDGFYSLTVSNRFGASTSPDIQVDVIGLYLSGPLSALEGDNATFCPHPLGRVGAITSWQWYFNGQEMPGQTNICLNLENVTSAEVGSYSVRGTGTNGTFTSDLRNFEVRQQAPEILGILNYSGSPLLVDQSLQICAYVVAGPPAVLQWQLNGNDIPGQTNTCLYISQTVTNDSGSYRLVASNIVGRVESAGVDVTVLSQAPQGTIRSVNGSTQFLDGDIINLCANITSGPRPALQWTFNDVPLPGETNECLQIFAASTNRSGAYNLIASNSIGVLVTAPLIITVVQQAPVFQSAPPANQTVVEGGTATFYAFSVAGPRPFYYLQHRGTNLPLAYVAWGLTAEFRLLGVTMADAGDYTLVASNALGTATSAVSRLTVIPAGPLDRWKQRNPLPQSLQISSVVYGSNLWVAAGQEGTLLTSTNGIDWTPQIRRSNINLFNLAYGNGLYVVVGETGAILSSPDGTNWTQRFSPIEALSDVTYGDGLFLVSGWHQNRGVILGSTNGIDWEIQSTLNFLPTTIAYGGGTFVASGMIQFQGDPNVATSINGQNWIEGSMQFPVLIEKIRYGGGKFIAVGGIGQIHSSTNGIDWVLANSGTTRRLLDVTFGNGLYAAVGTRGTLLLSADGSQWVEQFSGTPDRLETVGFANGLFVSLGENGTTITSSDGATWTKRNFGTTRDLDGMTVAFGKIIIAGKHGTILTSTNGVDYVEQNTGTTNDLHGVTYANGLVVAVGEPGVILTSPDAIHWTSRPSGNSNSLKRVTYGGGQWVAVGTEGTVVTSPDGITWTSSFIEVAPFGFYDLNAVAYGNGIYVIAGDGPFSQNGSSFYSTNGIDWTHNNYYFNKNLRAVFFAQGIFLAAGNDGTTFVSTNGIRWDARFASFGGNLREILYTNGFWTIVGNYGSIVTSSNIFDWTYRPTQTTENLHQVVDFNGRLIAIGNRGTILQSGRYKPALNTFNYDPVQGVDLNFAGIEGEQYLLQFSSDLVTWHDLTSFTNASEAMTYRDSAAGSNYRFYRLVEQ